MDNVNKQQTNADTLKSNKSNFEAYINKLTVYNTLLNYATQIYEINCSITVKNIFGKLKKKEF